MTYRTSNGEIPTLIDAFDMAAHPGASPMTSDRSLNARLFERLAAVTACPLCGAARREFDSTTSIAIAVFTCGADVVVRGGAFIVALGCKDTLANAFALIKADEETRHTPAQEQPAPWRS